MKKLGKKIFVLLLALLVSMSCVAFAACGDKKDDGGGQQTEQTAPEKVKDGEAISLTVGGTAKTFNVSDYITANGNTVSVSSSAPGKATAALNNGVVTVTAVAEGTATVTLTCGNITVTFAVTVAKAQTPAPEKYTVTLAGTPTQVDKGGTFKLPDSAEVTDPDFEFDGWNIEGEHTINGNIVTVNGNLTITVKTKRKAPVKVKDGEPIEMVVGDESEITIADYITTHGNDVVAEPSKQGVITVELSDGFITVTAVAAGDADITVICQDVTLTFAVTVIDPQTAEPELKQPGVTVSEIHDLYNGDYTVNLAENIAHAQLITGYTVNGNQVDAGKTTYVITKGGYSQAETQVTLTIVASYGDGQSLTYTYSVKIKDTSAYRIVNGGFEDGLTGWSSSEDEFNGVISEEETYWDNPKRPFDNDGKYYIGNGAGTETLTSPVFKVGNSGWVTFKLGSMRPNDGSTLRNVYMQVVKAVADGDDEVIAEVRNVLWSDPENAQRLMPYALNLHAYDGETVYFKIVDNEETDGNFRNIIADSFVTWYDEKPSGFTDLSAARYLGATAAIDLKDGNTATVTPIALSRGLVNATVNHVGECADSAVTVNGLTLTCTKPGKYTVIYNKDTASEFTAELNVTNTTVLPEIEDKKFTISDWEANPNGELELPAGSDDNRFTYAYSVDKGSVAETTFKYTADKAGSVTVNVTVTLTDTLYSAQDLPQIKFIITISVPDTEITLADGDAIEYTYDVYTEKENKESREIDFSEYLVIPEGKTVNYTVKMGEVPVELNGGKYTLVYADLGLSDTEKQIVFSVTAESGAASLAFTVTFNLTNTTAYRVVNGDFETGDLTGWTYDKTTELDFGRIEDSEYYWVWEENKPSFNKQGTYLFTGVETERGTLQEAGMGTLISSSFILKQNGWISFRMGGAHNKNCGVRVVTCEGFILSEFNNLDKGKDGTMDLYKYKFTGMTQDTECYIEIFDNATGGWGLVAVDDFKTFFNSGEPEGMEIVPVYATVDKYTQGQTQVYNGDFSQGADGWNIVTVTPNSTDIFAFVSESEGDVTWGDENSPVSYNNDGRFLQNGNESHTGYALSSAFEVSANGWMTFKLGGNKAACYVAIIDAETGDELAKFLNEDFEGAWPNKGWEMHAYKVNLIENGIAAGKKVRIKIVDNATKDYGVIVADSFITDYAEEPADADFKKINKVSENA